jgi:hypothetical protein
MVISPNRQLLALHINVKAKTLQDFPRLLILNANGQTIQDLAWDDGWNWLAGWMDDERLWFVHSEKNTHDSLILFNIITRQWQEFTTDAYPHIYQPGYPGVWNWGMFYTVPTIYDPTLSRVLYAKVTEAGTGGGLSLWNVQAGREIVFLQQDGLFGELPH